MPSTAVTTPPLPLHTQVWRANSLGSTVRPGLPSGFAELDAQLPGAGWPSQALSEILQAPHTHLEWRLLAPALRTLLISTATPHPQQRRSGEAPARPGSAPVLLLINPPHTPHLPGLLACGLAPEQLIWIEAHSPQQQLWATEQAIKAHAAAAVLAWLPQAQPEQIRRLQSHALGANAPIFLFRPLAVQAQSSAAPLRLHLSPGDDWCLQVHLFKRRGPVHEHALQLPALPEGLHQVLTPRMRAQPWPARPHTPAGTPLSSQGAHPTPTPAAPPTRSAAEVRHALARPAQPATSPH
ncbi:recombinase RecA [Roseateles koreensis]|uniref:Recombinase RecA n=1 Tax=Roseateles koreensis TaxID=2987526 RepID=A0ABT5KSB9_9BURK|nr:recombinase RecA [Roseateles koreensis]MDC8785833.1 recombinase RecA [Roseateles koreensis]